MTNNSPQAVFAFDCPRSAAVADPARPDDLRALGWRVNFHTDHCTSAGEESWWVFTKGNQKVEGRGATDAQALESVREKVRQLAEPLGRFGAGRFG